MVRMTNVQTLCDLCLADGKENDGTYIDPPIPPTPRSKPVTLAMCDPHRTELYAPLIEALTEHGQPAGNPRRV